MTRNEQHFDIRTLAVELICQGGTVVNERPHHKMRPIRSQNYFGGVVGVLAGFEAGLDAAPLGREVAPAGLAGATTPD
jgi:hypothetical protein